LRRRGPRPARPRRHRLRRSQPPPAARVRYPRDQPHGHRRGHHRGRQPAPPLRRTQRPAHLGRGPAHGRRRPRPRHTDRRRPLRAPAVLPVAAHPPLDQPYPRPLHPPAGTLTPAGPALDPGTLPAGGRFVPLPPPRWRPTRHWISPTPAPAAPAAAATAESEPPRRPAHPLLGRSVRGEGSTRIWQGPLRLADNPYLRDHCIQDTIILPGTAHLELIAAAAR